MSKFRDYLDERLGLDLIAAYVAKKYVPMHKYSFWYYWGGITLLCFIVQVMTGILLMVYYRPGHDAYESVRMITYTLPFGHFIRSIHAWSATLFLGSALVHMFSAFFMKAYRRPREFGWWTGIILLLFGLGFGFSGYLLPMDNLGFFATKVGMAMLESIPCIGMGMANLLRGGLQVGDNAAERFYTLHVSVMPIFFLIVLGLHLYLVQKHGMSIPPSEEAKDASERKSVRFIPNFAIRDLIVWLMVLNIIAILAWRFPWELGVQASALAAAPAGIHPEWYFMSSFQLLKVVGAFVPGSAGEAVGMIIFSLGLILWVLVPFYDVKTANGARSKIVTYCGLIVLFILVSMTMWGYAALQKGAHTMKLAGQAPAAIYKDAPPPNSQ